MITIDLHDYYTNEPKGSFVEVEEEVALTLLNSVQAEKAHQRRMYWNKAHYSLDLNDGIELGVLISAISPYDAVEQKVILEKLYQALEAIPQIQAQRVYAFYINGMNKAEMARAEGVSKMSIAESIDRGLENLKKILKEFC